MVTEAAQRVNPTLIGIVAISIAIVYFLIKRLLPVNNNEEKNATRSDSSNEEHIDIECKNVENIDVDEFSRNIIHAFNFDNMGQPKGIEVYPEITPRSRKNASRNITQVPMDKEPVLAVISTSKGKKGLALTQKALYDNISWLTVEFVLLGQVRIPLKSFYSIKYCSIQKGERKRLLINNMPLWGIFQDGGEPSSELVKHLYNSLLRINSEATLAQNVPSPLEIANSYEIFGLKSSSSDNATKGLQKAKNHYSEFCSDSETILFHKYKAKSFFSNEEHLLITDKHVFSYADYVEENHYQIWNLVDIRSVTVKGFRHGVMNRVFVCINRATVFSTIEDADRRGSPSHAHGNLLATISEPYTIAAMLCETVNSVCGSEIEPLIQENDKDGSATQRQISGPLKKLR